MGGRADDIKAMVDIQTALTWYGVNWNGWGKANCPTCGHKALTVGKDNPGVYYCHFCKKGGSVIDLVMTAGNFATPGAAMEFIESHAGTGRGARSVEPATPPPMGATTEAPPLMNIEQWTAAYKGSPGEAYLTGRGISTATAERFNIGYNAKERRVTIPTDTGYNARSIDSRTPKYKGNVGTRGFFPANWRDMITHTEPEPEHYLPAPVFVTEGELNAVSVMEATGYDGELNLLGAIAMGGAGSTAKLGEGIIAVKNTGAALRTFILMPDVDAPTATAPEGEGVKAMRALAAQLKGACIEYVFWGDVGAVGRLDVLRDMDVKDANAALVKNRDKFTRALIDAAGDAHEEVKRKREALRGAYLAKAAGSTASMAAFDVYKKTRALRPTVGTGLSALDDLLDGGLDERLYVFGATSSYGKTSFLLQIAEHISSCGTDVLFLSLEMGRNELIAKGISRRTYLSGQRRDDDGRTILYTSAMATLRTVLDDVKTPPSADISTNILKARTDYQRDAANLYIVEVGEGMSDKDERITVDFIGEEIARHITETNRKPVVIIDYLQLIEPVCVRHNEKQNMDYTAKQLRRLVRKHHIPILAISSIGRGAYNRSLDWDSFKESGGIEYTADVLIGLQARGLLAREPGTKNDDAEAKKIYRYTDGDSGRAAELILIKNRGGRTSGVSKRDDGTVETRNVINLNFIKKYGHFEELPNSTPSD